MVRVTFQELMEECKNKENFVLDPRGKNRNEGFFTDLRIDRDTVPEGYYIYEFRSRNGDLSTLENRVLIDHAGTLITKTPVKMNSYNFYSLKRHGYEFIYNKED